MLILRERDYFNERTDMHYALLTSAEHIGPILHTHEFFEIFLVIDGQIRHLVNGHQTILRAGSMTFIRPHDAHHYRPLPNQGCQLINLAIARTTINQLFDYLGVGFQTAALLTPILPPTINLSAAARGRLQTKLEQLHLVPVDHFAAKRAALRILLFEVVTQYFPLVSHAASDSMPLWLQRACTAMRQPDNLAGGVPRMVDLAAVSAEHLTRSVRTHLQQTPTEFVNQLRMTLAANLLTTTDMPIVDISAEVGIDSLSHFYRLFKRHYQLTPRQYRLTHMFKPN